MSSVRMALEQHLETIIPGGVATYRATTGPELSICERHVVPHRFDGIPLDEFMPQQTCEAEARAGFAV